MKQHFMVLDVESVGLHGEAFWVGWVVIDRRGVEVYNGSLWCPPEVCLGDVEGRAWVACNVPQTKGFPTVSPMLLRETFWEHWERVKQTWRNTLLFADCGWPVEARFLAACVDDAPSERKWTGPYPLHDIATVRMIAGIDPLLDSPRLASELPAHHPVADARQSARLLVEALDQFPALVEPRQDDV